MYRFIFAWALVSIFGVQGGLASYKYGMGSCPDMDPIPDFNMHRMLGVWHAIQETSTSVTCLTYNFTLGNHLDEYMVEEKSQITILGVKLLRHTHHSTGKLTVPDPTCPSKMNVKYSLISGTGAYTVLMTDYDNYAAVFVCQKLLLARRQFAIILSRQKTLDKNYVDHVRTRLSSYNIDPFALSIISQQDCPTPHNIGEEHNQNPSGDDIFDVVDEDITERYPHAILSNQIGEEFQNPGRYGNEAETGPVFSVEGRPTYAGSVGNNRYIGGENWDETQARPIGQNRNLPEGFGPVRFNPSQAAPNSNEGNSFNGAVGNMFHETSGNVSHSVDAMENTVKTVAGGVKDIVNNVRGIFRRGLLEKRDEKLVHR